MEKTAPFPSGEKSVESCHVSSCHGFSVPNTCSYTSQFSELDCGGGCNALSPPRREAPRIRDPKILLTYTLWMFWNSNLVDPTEWPQISLQNWDFGSILPFFPIENKKQNTEFAKFSSAQTPDLSVPKNRNRRKIAAFSNRKVLNRRFCCRNRRKIARKSKKKSQKNR